MYFYFISTDYCSTLFILESETTSGTASSLSESDESDSEAQSEQSDDDDVSEDSEDDDDEDDDDSEGEDIIMEDDIEPNKKDAKSKIFFIDSCIWIHFLNYCFFILRIFCIVQS